MSVIIHGIEPPTDCWSCRFRCRGYCVADKEHRFVGEGVKVQEMNSRMPWCPAHEVTDLIAALQKEATE